MNLTELIQTIDIVDFISDYVELTEKNGEYWGLSPFTNEKTPSFSVRRETKSWYDFSSGLGGNVFTFVCKLKKCSTFEAVRILKSFAGVTEKDISSAEKSSAVNVFKRYKKPEIARKAANHAALDSNVMERYEKRSDKLSVWENEGISKDSLSRFQVCYDAFSDRLVYPIRSPSGEIVNIGGRTLDPLWKEKGQSKYCYFYQWGTLDTIYGLYENAGFIRSKKEIILFEGCKSVLIADGWGIKNCGAILTSHLNPSQLAVLAKLGCRVVFALDKDVDVTRDHNIKKLKQYVQVEYITDTSGFLDSKDSPVDKGIGIFQKLYESRKPFRQEGIS